MVSTLLIDVSHIDLHLNAAGDAVDRAREYVADSYGCDGVTRSCRSGSGFHRESDFGGGEERIAAVVHQYRSGVSTFAFDHNSQTRWRGNRGYHTEGRVVLLENRTLLDVQFDECRVIIPRQQNTREGT